MYDDITNSAKPSSIPDDPFGDAMWVGFPATAPSAPSAPAAAPEAPAAAPAGKRWTWQPRKPAAPASLVVPAVAKQDAPIEAPGAAPAAPQWLAGIIPAKAQQDAPAATQQRPAWLRTWQEMLAQPTPTWLISGWLAPGDIGMLYGTPGTGKTFIALDIAMDAVLGQPAGGGMWAIPRSLQVAYCTSEGLAGLGGRLRAIGQRRGLLGSQLPGLAICAQLPQLFSAGDDGAAAWVAAVQAADVKADVVILDTLHGATAGADENSARDMGVVLGSVRHIRDALGCAVLLVHHANKSGGYRGSSALHGAVDLMARTDADDGSLRLSCEKLKDGQAWQPQNFRLSAADGGASAVVEWDGPSQDDSQALGREILRWLAEQDAQQADGWDARTIAAGLGMEGSSVIRDMNASLLSMYALGKLSRDGKGVKGDAYRYALR